MWFFIGAFSFVSGSSYHPFKLSHEVHALFFTISSFLFACSICGIFWSLLTGSEDSSIIAMFKKWFQTKKYRLASMSLPAGGIAEYWVIYPLMVAGAQEQGNYIDHIETYRQLATLITCVFLSVGTWLILILPLRKICQLIRK